MSSGPEVGLLVRTGEAAAFNLPFYSTLALPILFAADICLRDTTDDGLFQERRMRPPASWRRSGCPLNGSQMAALDWTS